MDFVSIWKAVSILVTGFFGGLALLTDFKDKTSNRITTWGYVSLIGIVCSTAFGVAAQLKERNDQAKEHQATLEQTLTLVKNTQDSIVNIKRVLSAIDEPVVEISYVSPCPNKKLSALCNLLPMQVLGKNIPPKFRPYSGSENYAVTLCLLKDVSIDSLDKENLSGLCDLNLTATLSKDGFWLGTGKDHLVLDIFGAKASIDYSSGKILSLNDIAPAILEISAPFEGWTPTEFTLRIRNAQEKRLKGSFVPVGSDPLWGFRGRVDTADNPLVKEPK